MFYGPEYCLFWFHVSLRKMCILLLLDEVVYTYALYPAHQWWIKWCPYWFSACCTCPFWWGVVNFPTITVDSSVSLCSYTSFCLIHFDPLLWGVYVLSVMFSWRIGPVLCNISLHSWCFCLFWSQLCLKLTKEEL